MSAGSGKLTAALIQTGLNEISAVDADVAAAFNQYGAPQPRIRPPGFGTLLNTIVSQQISTEAAAAIMARVEQRLPQMTAAALLQLKPGSLRDAGLSQRKVEYAIGLATAIETGELDIAVLAEMPDDEAVTAISSLRGFGRWSAEIYLMFSLGRRDIFPADDLALRVALGRLKGLDDRPTPKQCRELVAVWKPWRSIGSLFLWHYYRGAPA